MSKRYSAYLPVLIYISDSLILNFSIFCAHLCLSGSSKISNPELIFILLANFCWSTVSVLSQNFKLFRPLSLKSTLNKFLTSLVYHLLLIFAVIQLLSIELITKSEIFLTYFFFSVYVLFARSALFYILDIIRKRGYNGRRVAVIGDVSICNRLIIAFNEHPEYGYNIVKTIYNDELETMPVDELMQYLLSCDLNEINVCYKQIDHQFLNKLIAFSESNLIKLKLISDLSISNKQAQLISYDNIPAIMLTENQQNYHKVVFVKRVFDIAFSLTVMTFGMPIFVGVYLVTKTSSKGRAFYRQERIGRNGRPFNIYKFRSMHTNAEQNGPQLSHTADPRVTKWGKIMRETKLDELPQFWNVLKGEMSVVGPRPERQHFIEKILERKPKYQDLLNIRPGLTSIGQVSYGYAENIDQICDRVNHDLPYLQNMTIYKDIDIILKTVKVMVARKVK